LLTKTNNRPIAKWPIPIIGKLADNADTDYRPIISAPLI